MTFLFYLASRRWFWRWIIPTMIAAFTLAVFAGRA
jgi:hypothetical protein